MSFLGGIAGGIGSLVGGPVGGLVGKEVGGLIDGAFGGDKKKSSVDQMTSLLGPDGLKGDLQGKINPELANRALNLMSEAKTPEQKNKLADIAIYAMGGKPDQSPSSMNPMTNPALMANTPAPASSPPTDGAASPPPMEPEAPQGAERAGGGMPGERMGHHHHVGEGMRGEGGGGRGETITRKSMTRDANGDVRRTETTIHRGPGMHRPEADQTGSMAGAGQFQAASSQATTDGLSVNGNTVDTGRYQITASNDKDGDVKILDKQTNSYIESYGDPHVVTNDGDKADFQKNGLSIKLPDGTNVSLKPTATNDKGVSYLQGALVEKNGQAVTMDGMHGGTVQTSQVQPDSQNLQSQYLTPNQTVLSADSNDVGHLSLTGADGQPTTALNSKDHETSLDGMGGSLGGTGSASFAASGVGGGGSRFLPIDNPLTGKLSQLEHLNQANIMDPGLKSMNTYLLQAQLQAVMQQDDA